MTKQSKGCKTFQNIQILVKTPLKQSKAHLLKPLSCKVGLSAVFKGHFLGFRISKSIFYLCHICPDFCQFPVIPSEHNIDFIAISTRFSILDINALFLSTAGYQLSITIVFENTVRCTFLRKALLFFLPFKSGGNARNQSLVISGNTCRCDTFFIVVYLLLIHL